MPHAIRLLGPWTAHSTAGAGSFRVPAAPSFAGAVTLVRRFQWVAELGPGESLAFAAPALPAVAAWSLNGKPLAVFAAGTPARLCLPTLLRVNELALAFDNWPAEAWFPGVALIVESTE